MVRRLLVLIAVSATLVGGAATTRSEAATQSESQPGRILFRATGGACWECLYTMAPDGTDWRLVTDDAFIGDWTWSPHGDYIAVESHSRLEIMKPDGSDRSSVTSSFSIHGISWSPDGWTIAFSGRRVLEPDDTAGIWVVNRDGSGLRKIIGFAERDAWEPSWSPDGTKIAFASNRDGFSNIYVVNADGKGLTSITSGDHVDRSPDWSPTGDGIVFARDANPGGFPDVDLHVVASTGGVVTKLTDTDWVEGSPAWSPDGDKIAFHAYDGVEFDIYVMNSDGSGVISLTRNGKEETFPEWAPKGVGEIRGRLTGDSGQRVGLGKVELWTSAGSFVDLYEATNVGEYATATLPAGDYLALMYNGDTESFIDYFPQWYRDTPLFRVDLATSIRITDGPVTGVDASLHPLYADMWDSTFLDDIVWMQYTGVTRGCNPPVNDRFCPGDFVTRGQMAAFLVRALGYTDDGGGNLFVDDDHSVFEGDIDRLGTAGVTKGCNPPVNDRFCPGDFVTRGQMAAFLVRALGYTDDGGGNLFVDDDHSVFEGDIDRLGTAGVTKGCNPPVNDRFCPGDFVTRGQMAAFLHRALAPAFSLQSADDPGSRHLQRTR